MDKIKRNFYKRNTGRKTVLKQVVRPTFKVPSRSTSEIKLEDNLMDFAAPAEEPVETLVLEESPVTETSTKPLNVKIAVEADKPEPEAPPEEPKVVETKKSIPETPTASPDRTSDSTQVEIDEITAMIQQASQKLRELEDKKREQALREAQEAENEEVEEFDGVSNTDEEIELIKEQLAYYQKENNKLKHELELIKQEFTQEKKSLEKTVKNLKTELRTTATVQDNKFFDFSKELHEAVSAIEKLNDPNFIAESPQVVIRADQPSPTPNTDISATSVETPLTPVASTPKMINLELPKITKSESEPEPKKVEQAQPAPVEPAKVEPVAEAATPPTPDKKKKDKKAKSKKLLMTGVGALVILFGGGLASYQLTSTPKVDEKLVNEYMKQSVESQVLGIESQSKVPDGIVADKNSTASFDETKWAEYNDPIFGITLDYPANVTERLHSSNSITFLRKDSYLFKITYYSTDEDLEEFWSKTKDKGISYSAEPAEFKGKPALLLKLQEKIEYPGDRYLVKTEEKIYDIWFATDSNAYASDDVDRAEKMLENLRFI